ncbi:MAG: GHMP kinase [Kiritimatiellaeota bacterium]|nr:GHMP kinase [Kiritimatiellota bacterium]
MPPKEVIVSAPGSLMLMGEHAVLHGRRALCAALDQRMHVQLRTRDDRRIRLRSALGTLETTLDTLTVQAPFTFVLATLLRQRRRLTHGLDIIIKAEFSHQIGFGSSAAVTVALLRALDEMFALGLRTPEKFLTETRAIIHAVQGCGSGADAAASLCGGIVLYRAEPLQLRVLSVAPQLTAVYSGYKTPTPEVIAIVKRQHQRNPPLFAKLFDLMDDCVARAVPLISKKDWAGFGALLDFHHGLQAALGVNTPELEQICQQLRKTPGIHGAKISGSGLGDCAVGLGRLCGTWKAQPMYRLQVARDGVRVEK